MLTRLILLLLAVTAVLSSVEAKQISENQARAIAGQFFNVNMPQQPATLKGRGAKAAYYVFNNPEQTGWVIVAGDDRARTILAYGDEDYFDAQDVPECVQDWLNDYAEQMAHLDTATPQASCEAPISSFAASGRARIAPMLISNWAQGLPFNQQCPTYSNTSGETQYCPTGCVATAMAQILYYYRSSYGSIAIPAYTSEKDEMTFERPSLSATTFNYNIMNPWYDNAKNTNAGAKETARLMKYCGQSVKMDYGKNTSDSTKTPDNSHAPTILQPNGKTSSIPNSSAAGRFISAPARLAVDMPSSVMDMTMVFSILTGDGEDIKMVISLLTPSTMTTQEAPVQQLAMRVTPSTCK